MNILSKITKWGILAALLAIAGPARTAPLDHWTAVSSGTTNRLAAVAFGGGQFVACGDSGTVLTSTNGLVWQPVSSSLSNSLFGVAYGLGRFVAVGQSGTVITSSNGVAWASVTSGTSNALNAVTYSEPGFVAVGAQGTIITSSNGLDWMVQSSGTTARFVGVGSGFGKTYAGAAVNPPALFWSSKGTDWFYLTNVPPNQQPDLFNGGFAYGNGSVVGVRIRGMFCQSRDGVTWTNVYSPFVYCFGLVFARNQFVTVGGQFSSGGRTIGSSTDGLSWQTRYYQSSEGRLLGVAYGAYRFVAVGDGGSILVSAPMLWLSNPMVVSNELQMTLNGEPGGIYQIQTTTNLSMPTWEDIGVVTNLADTVQFLVPLGPDSPRSYYRAATN